MGRVDEPFLEYIGRWMTEWTGGYGRRRVRRAVAFYGFLAAVAMFAGVVVARDGQVVGAAAAIAIGCVYAACAVVCGRYGGR